MKQNELRLHRHAQLLERCQLRNGSTTVDAKITDPQTPCAQTGQAKMISSIIGRGW